MPYSDLLCKSKNNKTDSFVCRDKSKIKASEDQAKILLIHSNEQCSNKFIYSSSFFAVALSRRKKVGKLFGIAITMQKENNKKNKRETATNN